MVVCDEDFYSLQVPPARKSEYQEMCGNISNVLVIGSKTGSSELFPSAKAAAQEKFNF